MTNTHNLSLISDEEDHFVFTQSRRFIKGLPRELDYCIANECNYKVVGKVTLDLESIKYAWMLAEWRENLRRTFSGTYYIKVCIPCGHINVPHYAGEPMTKELIKEINSHAFDEPEYVGDCNHLYFHIPRWLGALAPRRLRWSGIRYKKMSTWDKPGWVEKEEINE